VCVVQASSLATVLIQALQSNDKAQLELCLSVTDQKVWRRGWLPSSLLLPVARPWFWASPSQVIDETVERLPTPKVVDFLKKLVAKFEANPSRGGGLARWIRSVLVQHTAHLMSVPDLVTKLSGLYQVCVCVCLRVMGVCAG
jgi:U3 small nucleolar RNA-associated protein 5